MNSNQDQHNNVDMYIGSFPLETQQLLQQVREAIKKEVPSAEECISYQMPAYKYHGMLVYFAGYTKHIGFYPTPSGITAFKSELSKYKCSKAAVQFPLSKPLPLELIARITAFRAKENLQKSTVKVKG